MHKYIDIARQHKPTIDLFLSHLYSERYIRIDHKIYNKSSTWKPIS